MSQDSYLAVLATVNTHYNVHNTQKKQDTIAIMWNGNWSNEEELMIKTWDVI